MSQGAPHPSSPGPAPPRPPIDLRLVPAALVTWLAAGLGVGLPGWVDGVAAVVLAAAAVGVVIRERRRNRARHRGSGPWASAVALALAAAALCLGVVGAAVHARTTGLWGDLVRAGASVQVVGVVRTEPAFVAPSVEGAGTDRVRVVIEVREVTGRGWSARARAPVLLLGPVGWADVDVGSPVRSGGRLVATTPGDDVVALLIVSADPTSAGSASPVQRAVSVLRDSLLAASADLEPDAAGLVPGIAIGDTSRLPVDLGAAMRTVSLTHLTAVSGEHVAIILGVVLGLTAWLRAWARAGVAVTVLVGFVLLVHPEPSVLRAAVMGAVAVLGLLIGRTGRAMPALASAILVLVYLDPWISRSYGFALSVLATAGIVLASGPWAAAWSRHLPRWLAFALAVPIAAQVACAPVVVLLQPALAVYAVPANLLAAPAVAPATVLGVLATLVGPWWPSGAHALAHAAGWCAGWIAAVARRCAELPGASVPWPGGVGGAALLAGLTLIAVLAVTRARWQRTRVRVIAAVLVCALVVAILPGPRRWVGGLLPRAWPPEGWVAVVCDVGQGSALVVRSGPGAAVMVDVGPDGDAAVRCLDALGVVRIDLLILTHLHDDHVGALSRVLAGRAVGSAILTPYSEPAPARAHVLGLLEGAGVDVATPTTDGAVAGGSAGDVRWDLLWPSARAVRLASGADGDTVNDMSLATVLRTPDLTILTLGDLETQPQAALARAVRRARAGAHPQAAAALSDVDVVIVAHHGSAKQDAALATLIGAELALVSVGADNDYGHPAPGALAMYSGTGAVVLRTDECGTIAVLADPLATASRC